MSTAVRPAHVAPHRLSPAGAQPGRPGVRPPAHPPVRRPVQQTAQPVDPWRWHDYATRVATVERTAWDSAASSVGHAAVDVRALVALRSGDRAVGALGARLGLTSGGATKLCRRLVELDLVERRDMTDDLRGVQVHLTEAGRDVAHRAALVYAEQVRRRAAELHPAA